MGREKRTQPGPRGAAKDRHKKAGKVSKPIDRSAPLPPGLVAAKPVKAITNTKHQSYFEFIENKERKKPLLLENTTNTDPPPGMRYIPIGNPELTERCQDISRELGASVYIVTKAKKDASDLSLQIHRVGYHIRENIVDRALAELGLHDVYVPELIGQGDGGLVEKIPDGQDEIDKQADAALRELFPRIPNTDRQQIIDHAFQKGRHFKGDLVVGLQQDLSLSRRVQLAVLAHIRHNHTRYDELLRETSWHNARRATEQLCLDILVKWRGDDENGRNQLDEILREVVVLSDDSDDEESGEEPDSESSEILIDRPHNTGRVSAPAASQNVASHRKRLSMAILSRPGSPVPHATPGTSKRIAKRARKRANHRERNFSRYEAARDAAWDSAMRRQRAPDCRSDQPGMADSSASHGRPAAPVDNGAPVNDDGHPHPQARPLPGQFGNNLIAHKEEQYGRLDRVLGEKAYPIMIEDQTVHPATTYRTGESVRDRFRPGVEILAVRRPRHDDGPEIYRPIPMDEGFIRLREDRPTEQRNGLAEEGFLRLRECPVTRPGPTFGDHRAYDMPQFRPVDVPGQAVYVRRAERPPPAELSYRGPGHGRVEGFRPERVVQGDFLSSADGQSNIVNTIHRREQHMVFLFIDRRGRCYGEGTRSDSTNTHHHHLLHSATGHVQTTA
ncbi:hypothetical protein QIS74_02315 [Colletotrichum tabaci]|uniref:DUF2293 domain-containing protein n=1 Tax=Colletotrichum tabaci TaxID=1209068 RepID=A0AAV9TRL4_9PEZI